MADPKLSDFISALSSRFALTPSSERKLFEYWENALRPHVFAHLLEEELVLQKLFSWLDSHDAKAIPHSARARLKHSQLFLLEAATAASVLERRPTIRMRLGDKISLVVDEKADPPAGVWFRRFEQTGPVSRSSRISEKQEEEAETIIVLEAISNAMRSAATELASANQRIEAFLSHQEGGRPHDDPARSS